CAGPLRSAQTTTEPSRCRPACYRSRRTIERVWRMREMMQEQVENCTLVERLRAAADTLEFISSNRHLLAGVPPEDRERLLRLAGEVYMPDPAVRRRWLKTTKRGRIIERRQREDAILSDTGIR